MSSVLRLVPEKARCHASLYSVLSNDDLNQSAPASAIRGSMLSVVAIRTLIVQKDKVNSNVIYDTANASRYG